ncbi:putative acyl-CoA thioester hydrolase [Uliginosibacterium paludis]|uniref:Pectinesterase n=1 Tax=Uliginosibacterium paludis TaxID=1615952 RepID=A0ABV2CSI6_9RHOO
MSIAVPPTPAAAAAPEATSASRPLLSACEAACFTPARYLAQGGLLSALDGEWQARALTLEHADFTVGEGGSHASVQAAVNAAIRSGRRGRQYIRVLPGCYRGVVYIPADAPPLTLFGSGATAAEVRLELTLDSRMSVADYIAAVNPAGEFQPGDPAWYMYEACSGVPAGQLIDTPAAAVFWSQAPDLELCRLSITNTLLDTVDGSTHQAVALRSDGDRTRLEDVRLVSRQDTFFCNAGERAGPDNRLGAYPTDRIARVYARHCYIEGDTDYVFGRASAVFEACHFHSVSSRHLRPAIIFAPNTPHDRPTGFLALQCRFTGDAFHRQQGQCCLGRSWDFAARNGYLPGVTSNGQVLVRDSHIDEAYSLASPWGRAATSARPHAGNCAAGRDLDDPAFNRLWEFNNRGPGARPA